MSTSSFDDLDIKKKIEKFNSGALCNKDSKMFHRGLVTCKSSPHLYNNSQDIEKHNNSPRIFKNLSNDCLNSPPFMNPHKALIDLYQKYSSNKSYSYMNTFSFRKRKFKKLEDIYTYCNKENTFTVKIRKNNRGLGLSIYGGSDASRNDLFSQLIWILNLHPLQPALECGKLALGDVILDVNGTSMLGLTKDEAIEVLRTAPADVELKIFRPPKYFIPSFSAFKKSICSGSSCSSASSSSSSTCIENTTCTAESCEFEATLMKRDGCLGFSIFHQDSTKDCTGGIYVKALTREHAISDGRIQPGDRILKVNGTNVRNFSHSEALACLRNASEKVTIKLYRCKKGTSSSQKCSLPKVYTFNVILERCRNEALGFGLWDSLDVSPDTSTNVLPCAAEVRGVFPSSLADKNGIKVGDRILEVNGESVLGKTADEVTDLLKKSNGVIRMVFCRLQQDGEHNF